MKKFLSFFAIAALLFTACEVATEESKGEILLKSNSEVTISSGNAKVLISYEIVSMVSGLEVVSTTNVDWIGNFDNSQLGKITFSVSENLSSEPRTGIVTVSYGDSKFDVTVNQGVSEAPKDKNITANKVVGHYYGNKIAGYDHLYYIAFTDKDLSSYEIDPTIQYFNVPDAYYYIAYILTNKEPADDRFQVPNGTYEVAHGGRMNSINNDTSWYQVNDSNGFAWTQSSYESGTLVVEDGKLTFSIVMDVQYKDEDYNKTYERESHTVTYTGDYFLLDMSKVQY